MKSRLERLYLARNCTDWGQLAKLLGISYSMLMQAKGGNKDLGWKTMARLEALEKELNLDSPSEVQFSAIAKAREKALATPGTQAERQKVFDETLREQLEDIFRLHELLGRKLQDFKDVKFRPGVIAPAGEVNFAENALVKRVLDETLNEARAATEDPAPLPPAHQSPDPGSPSLRRLRRPKKKI